ncbi:hypothetical protein B0H14DRAFT_3699480 [Mycena olivaceomarginata]|nr:hypothetical protein B0H14DRAFT_3699480 [Mycena olivaceomarginata]
MASLSAMWWWARRGDPTHLSYLVTGTGAGPPRRHQVRGTRASSCARRRSARPLSVLALRGDPELLHTADRQERMWCVQVAASVAGHAPTTGTTTSAMASQLQVNALGQGLEPRQRRTFVGYAKSRTLLARWRPGRTYEALDTLLTRSRAIVRNPDAPQRALGW